MSENKEQFPNQAAMEDIWKQLPKETNPPNQKPGEYIRYIATDPQYLYMTGFVNTKHFTFEEWEQAFQDCKQPDNSYLLSKDKFISLGKFKYSGPVRNPLDAMKIREGWYDINQWHEFCVKAIIPSTVLTVDNLVQAEKIMKEKGQITNGRIFIDKAVKLRIKQILDNYPSPTRRRELSVYVLYEKRLKDTAAKQNVAQVKTAYEKGAKLGTKEKKELSETLLKASKIGATNQNQANTISLKDLKKQSKSKSKK